MTNNVSAIFPRLWGLLALLTVPNLSIIQWLETNEVPSPRRPSSGGLRPAKTRKTCYHNCCLVLPCFHAARKHEMFLPYSRSKFCFLETKLTLETMLPRWQKWKTLGKHERATGVSGNMFCQAFRPADTSAQLKTIKTLFVDPRLRSQGGTLDFK